MGGGMLAGATDSAGRTRGQAVIIAGLAIQLIFFGGFMIVAITFHRRIHREPTTASIKVQTPWKTLLVILYTSSGLILVRSVFRVIEYIMGQDGVLMAHEVFLYVFDAVLMLTVCVSFNAFHPSAIINKQSMQRVQSSDSESQLGTRN
ncbi:hypothetical protein ACHAPJ_007560 [Fusarium lateritium]